MSLEFLPSNRVLRHARHYQYVLLVWINFQQDRAVFTKQLEQDGWCLHDSQCPLYLISLGHLLQREPVALLVQPESGDDQPLVPVLQQLRLGLARFELVFCPLSVVCPVRLLGLSDSNRHAVKVRPPVASNRLGLDERLRGEPPLLVLLLLDDQHQVGPHHHVGSAGPSTCHTSSVQTTPCSSYLVLSNIPRSSDFPPASTFLPPASWFPPS